MPSWTQKLRDTFTDVAGTNITAHTPEQGSGWNAPAGVWVIDVTGTELKLDTYDGSNQNVVCNLTVLGADQAVECVISEPSKTCGIFVRYTGGALNNTPGSNGYLVTWSGGTTCTIFRVTDGAGTQLATDNGFSFGVGDTMRVEITGTQIQVSVNGHGLSTNDSTYSSTGKVGLFSDSSASPTNIASLFTAWEAADSAIPFFTSLDAKLV